MISMMGTSTRYLALIVLSQGFLVTDSFVALTQNIITSHGRCQRTSTSRQWAAPHEKACNALQLQLGTSKSIMRNGHGVISSLQRKSSIIILDNAKDDAAEIMHSGTNNNQWQWQHYFSIMRPITIIQAVGAFLVGRLVILSQQQQQHDQLRIIMDHASILPIIMASLSIYLGYGAGMAMNDCADVGVDSLHDEKQNRSIASNAISIRDGWIFSFVISIMSIAFAWLADSMNSPVAGQTMMVGGLSFIGWTTLNLLLMAGYALGMQKIFLVKNILCGFFAISPLVGATLLGDVQLVGKDITMKLYQLAAIGFPLQISREILKDIEDVKVDQGAKQTLPLVIGKRNSKRIAYGLVAIVNEALLFSPYYWKMFASMPPVYAISVAVGVPMCFIASRLSLVKGQKLLKKSIYVLLSGMISGLLIQSSS